MSARVRRDFEKFVAAYALGTRRAQRVARGLELDVAFTPIRHALAITLRAAARHEAAHLVVGIALGGHAILAGVFDYKHPDGGSFRDGLAVMWTGKPGTLMPYARAGVIGEGRPQTVGFQDFMAFANAFDVHEERVKGPAHAQRLWKDAGKTAERVLEEHTEAHGALTEALLDQHFVPQHTILAVARTNGLRPPRRLPRGAVGCALDMKAKLKDFAEMSERLGNWLAGASIRAFIAEPPTNDRALHLRHS